MKDLVSNIKFKGSRKYLQGPDIFGFVSSIGVSYGYGFVARLEMKRFAYNQVRFIAGAAVNSKNLVGVGAFMGANSTSLPFYLEETEFSVTESMDYHEDEMVADANILEKKITNSGQNSYSTIENIVALTKKLNYHLNPNIKGKWVFGQINVAHELPTNSSSIEINQEKCLANRFSLNSIFISNENVGEISFIVGAP